MENWVLVVAEEENHRDVGSRNIAVCFGFHVYILDFVHEQTVSFYPGWLDALCLVPYIAILLHLY